MDEKTLNALKGSIEKWEQIIAGNDTDEGPFNCPLCYVFRNNRDSELMCEGCPIPKFCTNPEYIVWSTYRAASNGFVSSPRSKKLAQNELDYLKSLLPKGE